MTEHDEKIIAEARMMAIDLIKDFVRDSPLREKYMSGSYDDMSRQYLKPIFDVCYIAERNKN